jgi:hypothetical protein
MSDKFEIQLQKQSFAPGDAVHGWVKVNEERHSHAVQVSLRYQESTADYHGHVLSVPPVVVHQGEIKPGDSYEFNLQLPADAPPAYSSGFGDMYWELVVRSDKTGIDDVATQRIEVVIPRATATAGSSG